MTDNNPFQPATPKPADDSVLAGDADATNFAADAVTPPAAPKSPRPAVMLDGISPAIDVNEDLTPPVDPINRDVLEQALNDHTASEPVESAADTGGTPFSLNDLDNFSDASQDDSANATLNIDDSSITSDDAAANAPSDVIAALAEPDAAPVTDAIAALADQADSAPVAEVDKKAAKKAKKTSADSPAPIEPLGEKPPKQFTISIMTIILFILAVAGIGGTIYFWIQNSKTSDALADAKAKVQQLTDQSNTANISGNKTSDQFTALQKNLADMTKQNDDKQKTIDDQKKTIDDQTKQITDLTTKAKTIDTLTGQLGGLLNSSCNISDGTSAGPCTATITPAQGDQAAKLVIKPAKTDQ